MTNLPTSPYPLAWPDDIPRTATKATSQFRTTLGAALNNVRKSLELFGADSRVPVKNIVLTSNVTLGHERPADAGIAVWFEWDGQARCIAVDRYPKAEHNLQAVHHIVEARRTEMRHGGLHIVRQTFKGFVALPAPAGKTSWRQVFGLAPGLVPSKETVEQLYRSQANEAHPDKGGSHEKMAELNRARREALAEIGGH